ncbi:MAG TPA: serine/threonine-protein kinase [Isosphaeraceae bacterium]|jgi:serine/threonine protein kinase|nr:serine/threonine-protein kinase [Isosphaeraceae bacterium]
MGAIFRAREAGLDRVVAYKVMRPHLAASAEARDRFRREAQATAELCHPGIVPVFGLVTDACGLPAYAMELVEGQDLEEAVKELRRQGPADPDGRDDRLRELIGHVARTCRIVAFAHGKGYIHGDIKPRNILIAGPEATRMLDWGVARRIERRDDDPAEHNGVGERPHFHRAGTYDYQGPSADRGEEADERSDVLSLGVTLFYVLAGRTPGRGPDRDIPRHLDDVLPALLAIARTATEPGRADRYQAAADLAEDIEHALNGERVAAYAEPPIARARRWIGENPWKAAAAVFSAIALLIAAAVGFAIDARRQAQLRDRDIREARDRRERDLQAAREQHESDLQKAHDALVAAARDTARRGDWPRALDSYRRAIADGRPDRLRLRVERLAGFFAVGDRPTLEQELNELKGRTDLDRLAAPVDLARGSLLLCNLDAQDEGRRLVRRALRRRKDLISDADPDYAEALAETNPRKVIEHLRSALAREPLHFPSHGALLAAFLSTGELAEARRQCDQMERLFPASTPPTFIRATADLIEGNQPSLGRRLDELTARLGPSRASDAKALRAFCETATDVFNQFDRYRSTPGGLGFFGNLKLASSLARLRKDAPAALRPVTFPVPTVGLFLGAIDAIAEAYSISRGPTGMQSGKLMALFERHPDAMILALAVSDRLPATIGMIREADLRALREAFTDVARLAERSANIPTLVPHSAIGYQARILGAIMDVSWLKITPGPGREHVERLLDQLRVLVTEGRRREAVRQEGLVLLLKMLTSSLNPKLAADWKLDTPDGLEAYRRRCRLLSAYGRSLLENWLDDEPDNAVARGWLEQLRAWAERQEKGPDFAHPPGAGPPAEGRPK